MGDTAEPREPQRHLVDRGHHHLVGQPHRDDEGPIAEAEQRAAQLRSDEHRFGQRGQRFNRRSPFVVGLTASAGVALTYGAVRVLGVMSSVLELIGVAMFFALGLETAVSWLINRKLPRWAAVTIVVTVVFMLVAGTLAATIPPLVQEARQFVDQLPHYIQLAQDRPSLIGRINERVHLQQRITDMINGSGRFTFAGIVKTGSEVFGVVSHVGVVAVLTVYFLADMRRIRAGFYRLMPNSRRPRAVLIGDEVVAKFGSYLFGNVLTSVIAGAATFVWCILLQVPYAVLLGVVVAVLDLFPYGSTIGGFIVAAVAVSVSIPVCIATVVFYVAFRLAEDYLLTPRIVGRAVKVPAGVTVVAVLLGAAWLGIVGALVAIPIAAAVQLLVQGTAISRTRRGLNGAGSRCGLTLSALEFGELPVERGTHIAEPLLHLVDILGHEAQLIDDLLGYMPRVIRKPLRSTATGHVGPVTDARCAVLIDDLGDTVDQLFMDMVDEVGHLQTPAAECW